MAAVLCFHRYGTGHILPVLFLHPCQSNTVDRALAKKGPVVTWLLRDLKAEAFGSSNSSSWTGCSFFRSSLRGAAISSKCGMKRRYMYNKPRDVGSYVWVLGCLVSLKDFTQTSSIDRRPGRIIWPGYFAVSVKSAHVFNLTAIPASRSNVSIPWTCPRWSYILLEKTSTSFKCTRHVFHL